MNFTCNSAINTQLHVIITKVKCNLVIAVLLLSQI